jgi:hypothetical protein
MRSILPLLASLALATVSRTAHAQASVSYLPNGPALGISATRFAETLRLDGSVTALTFRRTDLRRNAVGLELDAGVFPQALPFGALITSFDIGPGYNLSLPGVTVVLRAGGGGILAIGRATELIPGAHLGASTIIHLQSRLALRLELLRHFYLEEGELYPYWGLGLGFAVLPRSPAPVIRHSRSALRAAEVSFDSGRG